MITFESRHKAVRNADIITRKAHNEYPHISTSKLDNMLGDDMVKEIFWGNMNFQYQLKLVKERLRYEDEEKNLHSLIIESMKNKRLGNCYEEAKVAEAIGKLNGQSNIYSAKIFYNKKPFHEIAFVTDKEIKPNKKYKFKGKEAVIIDPWLSTTSFAGEYFTNLKNTYKNLFPEIKRKRKMQFKVEADFSSHLTSYRLRKLKKNYPELILQNFKKIKF